MRNILSHEFYVKKSGYFKFKKYIFKKSYAVLYKCLSQGSSEMLSENASNKNTYQV